MKDFNSKILKFRKSQGWTRKDVYNLTGLPESTLERWENNGKRKQTPPDYEQCWYIDLLISIVLEQDNPYGHKERIK